MMQKYWQELVDIWPELKPYVDQIHVVYAGLSPGESVLNQSEHLIKQEVEHALQQRKRVLFYGVEEGFIKPVLYKIQSVVESINFEPHQLVFTTSAVNGQEIYNKLVKEEQIMTITYTLWQGSQLLAVNQKASKPEEILAVIAELNKLGKGFTYNIREVEVK